MNEPISGDHPISHPAGTGRRSKDSLSRLVAIACTFVVGALALLFLTAVLALAWTRPDLSDYPLLLPLVGAGVLSASLLALIGLVAAILDLFQTDGGRGTSVLAVFVNGGVCLAVFFMIVTTIANSL